MACSNKASLALAAYLWEMLSPDYYDTIEEALRNR